MVCSVRADDAEAALAVQLEVARSSSPSEDVPEGFVISVSEPAGTELARGSQVVLEVSSGPPPIPVPDVRFNSGAVATQMLEDSGFVVSGIEGSPSGMVLATDSPAGELHRRGTRYALHPQLTAGLTRADRGRASDPPPGARRVLR